MVLIFLSWEDYANEVVSCSGLPQQFPPPFPSGTSSFASWAIVMASETPTPTIFDFEAASAIVDPPLTPEPPPSTSSLSSSTSSPLTATTAVSSPNTSPQSTATMMSSTSSASDSASASFQITSPAPSHLTTASLGGNAPPNITSFMSSSTVTPSVSGSNVAPTSTFATSSQSLTSTDRHSLPTGAIVGIVIGTCAIVLTILLVRLYCLRRKAAKFIIFPVTPPDTDTEAASNVAGISDSGPNSSDSDPNSIRPMAQFITFPATLPDTRTESVSDVAGTSDSDPHSTSAGGLSTRALAIQDKFPPHVDSGSPVSSSATTYPTATHLRVFTAPSGWDTDVRISGPDVISQLREVTARVRQLEAQLESPPVYSGEAR
ncbi:hypothetical protein MSAN_00240500 [Mycena sanguinolenta]|uniref:Uncharacterized protein n=1 Tax=Mycena sanguinolenta TaxID=230812 RepID=A0A8H7DL51_9AGAR|nr:hypothetical protein MSAN_00240500 [Mycena sanguinolenta]